MGTIKVDTVTGLADPNKVSLSSGATLQVDEIVNVSGDKDSGINLATNDNIKFNIAGSQKAVIDDSGNVLVGRASTISGGSNSASGAQIGSNGLIQSAVSGDTAIALQRLSDDGDIIQLRKDTTVIGKLGSNSGTNLIIGTSDTGVYFNSGSDAVHPWNVSSGSGATRDNAIDLGRSGDRFKDLYLGGGLYVGGTGSANYLDDYEEGTFTAAFSAASGTVTIDDSFKTGVYTKIGSVVTFTLHARVASVSGNSGNLTITGLPFTTPNDNKYRHTIGVMAFFTLTGMTNLELPFAYLSNNSSTLNLAITNTNNLQALNANRVQSSSEFYITGSYQVTS